jgi:hypothetical protein
MPRKRTPCRVIQSTVSTLVSQKRLSVASETTPAASIRRYLNISSASSLTPASCCAGVPPPA